MTFLDISCQNFLKTFKNPMTNCFETPELGALVFDFNWRKRLGALGFDYYWPKKIGLE